MQGLITDLEEELRLVFSMDANTVLLILEANS